MKHTLAELTKIVLKSQFYNIISYSRPTVILGLLETCYITRTSTLFLSPTFKRIASTLQKKRTHDPKDSNVIALYLWKLD